MAKIVCKLYLKLYELAHSKLNMVYLTALLVVMTNGLKIVRLLARIFNRL